MKRLFKIGSERHDVGKVVFSWHPDGNFLASAGRNGIIHITDRHGDIVDEIPLSTSSPVLQLEWDRDGEYLAVLQDGNGVVPLWNLSTKRIVPLETNLKDPSFLAWSKTGPQLAVGTQKGSLLIYNKSRKQKIPIVGKHSKRITCGGWSTTGNKLVLASDDKTLTISNEAGDTLLQTDLRHYAIEAKFTLTEKSNLNNKDDNIISANLNGKSLLLYNIIDEKEDPLELTFAPRENGNGCRYGDLMKHAWYTDDNILVGFSDGYLLSVATSAKELGEEKFCSKLHTELVSFSYNPVLKKIASAGNDGVRILDVHNFKEITSDYIPLDDLENSKIHQIAWSPDGQILTVSTNTGNIYNFLAKMSVLFTSYKSTIAYLSSLREISIIDGVKKSRPLDVTVRLEPSLIAVGGRHVAAGMNNRVYYHRIGASENTPPVNEQEYVGIVKEIQLNNDFAVILTDSKAIIHPIEPSNNSQNQTKTFPNREEGSYSKVTCVALTDNFFFYGTEAGTVEVFFLTEWTLLSGIELRLENPIKKIYPNVNGTRIIVIDGANQVFLYNPVNGTAQGTNKAVTRFEATPMIISNVLWDLEEKNVIMLYDNNAIHTYIYIQASTEGSKLLKLGPVSVSNIGEITMKPDKVDIVQGNTPILSANGILTCQTSGGNITTIVHPFFDRMSARGNSPSKSSKSNRIDRDGERDAREEKLEYERKMNYFCQCLALHKLEKAWELAVELDKRSFFLALSHKAMETLNVELATRVYNQLGDAGMVMALRKCQLIEDKNLLAGHISLLFCDYQRAQDLFLSSSRPITALDMRKDLMQWDQALKLAQVLSPNMIPEICIQYGQQLEARDEIDSALKMYEEALHALDSDGNRVIPDHLVPPAMMGIARGNLRLGNVRQGIRMANELDDKTLFTECGHILEIQKQYSEAAAMYVKGLQYEKAALIYTKYLIKNDKGRISEAAAIMDKVENDALNSAFAKACASAGRYEDALKAYTRANDYEKVVEILLKNLDQAQKAFDLVRNNPTSSAAQLIAEYCQANSDYRGTIEFLLIANKIDDAFKLAAQQNMMETFTSFLGESISSEDAVKVANFYEKLSDFSKAGKFHALAANYSRALKFFLQCGDREIDAAIEVVGKSQNDQLTHQLIDFLVGEKDGIPKDPNYLYRLSLALKKYDDAAKTALIITRQEMDLGNYMGAHKVVSETIRYLEDAGIKVNLQLRTLFILLHSYILAKLYVGKNDHLTAARLLLRVATNISKFPLHIVPILSSTVVECHRAGLKQAAYDYAATLVRPEYRAQIPTSVKRQIEGIVRRRGALSEGDEPIEETSPDPISGLAIPVTQLESPTTRDSLPMCIISGKHMVLDDWCFCPISKFPALYSEYVRYIREMTKKLDSASVDSVQDENLVKMKALSRDDQHHHPQQQQQPQTDNDFDEPLTSSMKGNSKNNNNSATDMFLSAPDPIMGKSVSVNDLILCTKEDAIKYVQRYNNVFEKKKDGNNNNKDDEAAENGENNDNEKNENDKEKKSKNNGDKSPNKSPNKDNNDSSLVNDEDAEMMGFASASSSHNRSKGSSGSNSKKNASSAAAFNEKDRGNNRNKAKFDRIQRNKRKRTGGGGGVTGDRDRDRDRDRDNGRDRDR